MYSIFIKVSCTKYFCFKSCLSFLLYLWSLSCTRYRHTPPRHIFLKCMKIVLHYAMSVITKSIIFIYSFVQFNKIVIKIHISVLKQIYIHTRTFFQIKHICTMLEEFSECWTEHAWYQKLLVKIWAQLQENWSKF